jgi:ABC-type branched-subunit amino acid transport system ATPase component
MNATPQQNRLAVERLSWAYEGRLTLSDVSLGVGPGDVLVIQGENGSGKSTLARLLIGIIRSRTGRIFLDGKDVTELEPRQRVALGLRSVPQEARTFRSLTVRDNVALLSGEAGSNRMTQEALSQVLGSWIAANWRAPAGNLSGGQQAMLAIAAAAMNRPKVLVLDEPGAGLDDQTMPLAARIISDLSATGTGCVIFEQRAAFADLLKHTKMSLRDGLLQ